MPLWYCTGFSKGRKRKCYKSCLASWVATPGRERAQWTALGVTMLRLAVLVAAIALGSSARVDFAKYKTCQQCTGDGYGWCPHARRCGGFANSQCSGTSTDLRAPAAAASSAQPAQAAPAPVAGGDPVQQFVLATSAKLMAHKKKTQFLVFLDSRDAATKRRVLAAMEVARAAHGERVLFLWIAHDVGENQPVSDRFGVDGSALPAPRMAKILPGGAGVKPYKPSGRVDVTVERGVSAFVDSFFAKQLSPVLRSQPASSVSSTGPVAELVGDTFEGVVMDDSKDVLVFFYMRGCGHCKSLMPHFEKLASSTRLNSRQLLVKIDGVRNDVAHEEVILTGYPTLYLFRAGGKDKPVQFVGDRNYVGLEKFLKRNKAEL